MPEKRVVVVAGSGRSGTSTIAGVLKSVGLKVPTPEVPGNHTNPRGFFEPQWAVDFQTGLLRKAAVALTDARPAGFEATAEIAAREPVRAEVGAWVAEHLADADELLVKDPRNSWFLPMWRRAAADAGAGISFLTMLRHPAEVVGSKDTYYQGIGAGETVRQVQTVRVGSWLNVALFTEATTRDGRRSFVPYSDLLAGWRAVVARVVPELDLQAGRHLSAEAVAEIDAFVDPGLRRVRTGWDQIECPDRVRELAEETWEQLAVLAGSGGFDAEAQARLDELRAAYVELYADAEAVAASSVQAARRMGAREGRRKARQAAGGGENGAGSGTGNGDRDGDGAGGGARGGRRRPGAARRPRRSR